MKISDLYDDKTTITSTRFSDIYKAIDKSTNAPVCLKVVDEDLCHPPHSIRQEIDILKKLNESNRHPHILEYITDLTIYDDKILVTPLYDYNLQELIKSKKYCRRKSRFNDDGQISYTLQNTIEESDVTLFLKNFISGLAFIHDHGIIHRDIKMSNIFYKNKNGDCDITNPVIGDFGISYDCNNPPKNEPIDKKFTDVSTGIYKSPVLILGYQEYGFEIDVYSTGVMMTILYSPKFMSPLEDVDDSGEVSDLRLLHKISDCFGIDDKLIEISNENHFKLVEKPQKDVSMLLPRCNNDNIKQIFTKMIHHQITTNEILGSL